MLELEVLPEMGLTSDSMEFLLGMHFSHAVAIIQSLVGNVKGVHILYNDSDPLRCSLAIKLTNDGISLIFDPINQRLKMIEVFDPTLLRLRYCEELFSCPEVSPTKDKIEQTFGATHPGTYNEDNHLFTMTFRGLCFQFGTCLPDHDGDISTVKPVTNFDTLRVTQMYIYCGNNKDDVTAPKLPIPRYPCVYQKSVEVLRSHRSTLGLRLLLQLTPAASSEDDYSDEISVSVYFGDSVQDVMSRLGAPSRIFFKSENKMKIHLPHALRNSTAFDRSDYFYNYFTLGIDLLFDARTNRVKKLILHTNYPGHYNFNIYHRCQFSMLLDWDRNAAKVYDDISNQSLRITPFTKWSDISAKLRIEQKPVVLNRYNSANNYNPFGPTFCHGYQDIIFEAMSNGHIASITFYAAVSRKRMREVAMKSKL